MSKTLPLKLHLIPCAGRPGGFLPLDIPCSDESPCETCQMWAKQRAEPPPPDDYYCSTCAETPSRHCCRRTWE